MPREPSNPRTASARQEATIVRAVATFALALVLAPLVVDADSFSYGGSLPTTLGRAAIAFDGTHAYLFGGWSCTPYWWSCDGVEAFQEEVYRYDPATGAVTQMGATLWLGNAGSAAVWAEELGVAVLFGGHRCIYSGPAGCDASVEVFTYDPALDDVRIVAAALPTPRAYAAAAWDGRYAWVLGGADGPAESDQILRYDPTLDTVTPVTARVPAPLGFGRYAMSAVWADGYVYGFGGITDNRLQTAIFRYDPAADRVDVMTARLPIGLARAAAFFDGEYVYLAGGARTASSDPSDLVVRYHPATDTVLTMSARLPIGAESPVGFWDPTPRALNGCLDGCAHVLGGLGRAEISRYTIEPGPPRGAVAGWGPGPANITITWQPPAENTHSRPVVEYRLWRSENGGPLLFAGSSTALSYRDADVNASRSYVYRVQARDASGTSSLSDLSTVAPPRVPTAPRSPTATAGPGAGQLTLRWLPPADAGGAEVYAYRLSRSTSSLGPFTPVTDVAGTSYLDSGLGNGRTWWYRLTALNAAGESPSTAAFGGATGRAPDAPNNVRAVPALNEGGAVVVTWDAARANGLAVTEYRVYRGDGFAATDLVATLPGHVVSYRDTGLATGAYTWAVVAVNPAGASGAASSPGVAVAR